MACKGDILATSEELSRTAYSNWQLKDTERNRINFIKTMQPYILKTAQTHIKHKFSLLSLQDKEDLAVSMISEVYQRLHNINRKKHYKEVIAYIGLIVESRLNNILQYNSVFKRIATLVHLDKLIKLRGYSKDIAPVQLLARPEFNLQEHKFFELLNTLCKNYFIKPRDREFLIDKYYYGYDLGELVKKYGNSRQTIHAAIKRYFDRIKTSKASITKELKELLHE